MGREVKPEGQKKYPNQNEIRLKYPSRAQIEQVNNVASWLGVTTVEFVKGLITAELKNQPEKYRLTPRPKD